MAGNERLVKVQLLGHEFSFYTASSEEEMAAVLRLVKGLVEGEVKGKRGTLAMGKIAVAACFNIASRHVRLEREFAHYRQDSEERLRELTNEISALIKE